MLIRLEQVSQRFPIRNAGGSDNPDGRARRWAEALAATDALRVAGAEPAVWVAPGSRFPDLVDLVS